jgi:hypothetical protein
VAEVLAPLGGCFFTPRLTATLHTAVPNWQAGDTIPLGADKMLRVIKTRFDDPDDPVLVVELA